MWSQPKIFYPITLSIPEIARDYIWYKRPPFYNSNFFIPNWLASLFRKVFWKKVSTKMTSLQGCRRLCRERLSIAIFVTPPDSSLPPELDDKLSKQPARPSEMKLLIAVPFDAATNIPKYSENDLQRIFKIVLEAWALAPILTSAISKVPRDKLTTRSLDIYHRKFHIDCYNICQQCENYFITAGATGPIQIPFATFFLQNRISFRWRQYKRKRDADSFVSIMRDKFKTFLRYSLGDSQVFVEIY